MTLAPETTVRWDLSPLYDGPTDPRIASDLDDVRAQLTAFRATYQGQVATLSAAALHQALVAMERTQTKLERLAGYAWMAFYTDTTDEDSRTLYQRVWGDYTVLSAEFEFFKQELKYLPLGQFDALLAEPVLAGYAYWLRKLRNMAPYTLPESEEALLARKMLSGEQAWTQLYTEATAALRVSMEIDGQLRSLTLSETRALRPNPDRRVRRDAHIGTLEAYAAERHLIGYLFNTLFQDHLQTLELRQMPDLMAPVLMDHDVAREVVDAVIATTQAHYGLAQRYYRLKAKVLGLADFSVYDVFAPYPKAKSGVSFDEGRHIVQEALEAFYPPFGGIAKDFFEGRYIDPFPRAGKPQGAFCFGLGPSVHPFIFLNYGGTLGDVVTLAHELGHGIHFVKAAERQSQLNTYTVPPMLETVSIFAEMVVFERLLASASDPAVRVQLLASQLEGFLFNVHRQVTMTAWELGAYAARRQGEVTTETFGQIWLDVHQQFYGDAVALSEADQWGWMTNPFFVSQRFINYAYAFGQLLVYALYQQYKHDGPAFIQRYEAMLELGGAASPKELLAVVGVDLTDADFWKQGFDLFEALLERFEAAIQENE